MNKLLKNLKNGFTLAEVLITLVIIGVIAAMTIPTLVTKYQKEQTVNQLKQVFSQLNQAAMLSVPQYGDMSTWDYMLSDYEILKKYFKFVKAKEMVLDRSEILYLRTDGGYENQLRVSYNGQKVIVLNSGAIIYSTDSALSTPVTTRCYTVDINGLRGPNKYGRDAFFLCLDGERGRIIPHQLRDGEPPTTERTRDQLLNYSDGNYNYRCNKTSGRGMWCAAVIMKDGWQIKDDYPW